MRVGVRRTMSNLTDKMKEIKPLIDEFTGEISLSIKSVNSGELLSYKENDIRPTASTIKVMILGHLLSQADKNHLSLDQMVKMTETQQERGTGILKEFTLGTEYVLRDVAMAMMVLSDNTATNMCIDLLGGVDAVNKYIKSCGLEKTKLNNRVEFETIGNDASNLAVSTTEEFTYYLNQVQQGKAFSKPMTDVFFDMMSRQQDLSQFARYLPYNPYAKELNMEQDFYLANKTGTFTGVRCDVGYAKNSRENVIFSIFTEKSKDERFNIDNENAIVIGKIAKIIMDE